MNGLAWVNLVTALFGALFLGAQMETLFTLYAANRPLASAARWAAFDAWIVAFNLLLFSVNVTP